MNPTDKAKLMNVILEVKAEHFAGQLQGPAGLFMEALAERDRQDEQWGGPAHDDTHDELDWSSYIDHQTHKIVVADVDKRQGFVKIMALAMAAIESIDRKAKP